MRVAELTDKIDSFLGKRKDWSELQVREDRGLSRFDVVVIGAGVAGLMAAEKFSSLGLSVAIVEKEKKLAPGASTKNEGWLHNGTYHSFSIQDETEAGEVAKRCLFGHNYIKQHYPESVDTESKTFAILKDQSKRKFIERRWEKFGVPFEQIEHSFFGEFVPEVVLKQNDTVYSVRDTGINTRILYSRLVQQIKKNGVKIYSGIELQEISGKKMRLKGWRQHKDLSFYASNIIFCTGYSTEKVISQLYGLDFFHKMMSGRNFRYWKSHLMMTPRLTKNSVYVLDEDELTLINHDEISLIGFNADAVQTMKIEHQPSLDRFDHYLQIINKTIPFNGSNANLITCTKIDISPRTNDERSLNIKIEEFAPNHFFVLPGKMTEAPFLCNELVKRIYSLQNTNPNISLRPIDILQVKLHQGEIEMQERYLSKKMTYEEAKRIIHLAQNYKQNLRSESRVLEYSYENGKLMIPHIDAPDLTMHGDQSIGQRMVKDLAFFHSLYRRSKAQVLYRDAIPSNHLLKSNDEIVHIDFAGSKKIVHAFDDLALLLLPEWSGLDGRQIDELIYIYLEHRERFDSQDNLLSESQSFLEGLDSVSHEYYSNELIQMKDSGTVTKNLEFLMEKVDYDNLVPSDFYYFFNYRRIRAKYYQKVVWDTEL